LGMPNNSMEPPPLCFAKYPERAGDLRPIPASRVFGFGAILAFGWPRGSPQGAPQISRPFGIPVICRPKEPPWRTPLPPKCFVCRKHRGLEIAPGGPIFENDLVYISHAQLWGNESTHYLGHLFVEPKRHVTGLAGLSEEEAREIGLRTSLVAKAIQDICGAEHVYSFVIGDHVPHVHVHIIGRSPGAPKEYWGTKVDEWPGAPRGGEVEIAELAQKLKLYLLAKPE